MHSKRESEPGSSPAREPFTTIDDLLRMAQELVEGLSKLGETKHPLEIRRGVRKGVEKMAFGEDSQSIKAGSKTYFFDIKRTSDGKPYLVITESRFKGEGMDRERASIVVFPEHAQEFAKKIEELARQLG